MNPEQLATLPVVDAFIAGITDQAADYGVGTNKEMYWMDEEDETLILLRSIYFLLLAMFLLKSLI